MSTKVEEFIKHAFEHYNPLYLELKTRYGLKAISDEFVENNGKVIVHSSMWADVAEQLGMDLIVEFAPGGGPQLIWMAIAEKEIEEPDDLYELWHVVTIIKDGDIDNQEKLEALDLYDGPEKLEVPDDVFGYEEQPV